MIAEQTEQIQKLKSALNQHDFSPEDYLKLKSQAMKHKEKNIQLFRQITYERETVTYVHFYWTQSFNYAYLNFMVDHNWFLLFYIFGKKKKLRKKSSNFIFFIYS